MDATCRSVAPRSECPTSLLRADAALAPISERADKRGDNAKRGGESASDGIARGKLGLQRGTRDDIGENGEADFAVRSSVAGTIDRHAGDAAGTFAVCCSSVIFQATGP